MAGVSLKPALSKSASLQTYCDFRRLTLLLQYKRTDVSYVTHNTGSFRLVREAPCNRLEQDVSVASFIVQRDIIVLVFKDSPRG